VAHQARLRIAVAVEAKIVESSLYSHLDVGAGTAMAVDAGIEAAAICIVVMAGKAIDGHMLGMIKSQRQRL